MLRKIMNYVEMPGSVLVRKQVDGEPGSELARGLGGISQGLNGEARTVAGSSLSKSGEDFRTFVK